jgi:hypothetical protein
VSDQVRCSHPVIRDETISRCLSGNPSKWNVFGIVVNQVLHRQHGDSVLEEVGPLEKI